MEGEWSVIKFFITEILRCLKNSTYRLVSRTRVYIFAE